MSRGGSHFNLDEGDTGEGISGHMNFRGFVCSAYPSVGSSLELRGVIMQSNYSGYKGIYSTETLAPNGPHESGISPQESHARM